MPPHVSYGVPVHEGETAGPVVVVGWHVGWVTVAPFLLAAMSSGDHHLDAAGFGFHFCQRLQLTPILIVKQSEAGAEPDPASAGQGDAGGLLTQREQRHKAAVPQDSHAAGLRKSELALGVGCQPADALAWQPFGRPDCLRSSNLDAKNGPHAVTNPNAPLGILGNRPGLGSG